MLLGDTNCDFACKPTEELSDNNAKHLRSIYDLFSFTQLVKEPTRVTLEAATLMDMDHITTTFSNNLLESTGCSRKKVTDLIRTSAKNLARISRK